MQQTCRFLFAYGTLMSAATAVLGRQQRVRLLREAAQLGPATTAGRLYDLGRYPGMVMPPPAGHIVHGEAFELTDPALSLPWLDAYEGITPARSRPCEYARVECPVSLANGRAITAFVYVYQGDTSAAVVVPDGRWLSRSA